MNTENNRKLIMAAVGCICLTALAITALIMKAATFDAIYTPVGSMVTAIVTGFYGANLLETRMKKNGGSPPAAPTAPPGGGQ